MFGARSGLLTNAHLADIRHADSEMKELDKYWAMDAFQSKFMSPVKFCSKDMVSALHDSIPYLASDVSVLYSSALKAPRIPLPTVDVLLSELLLSGDQLRSVGYANGRKTSKFFPLSELVEQWRNSAMSMLGPDELRNVITGDAGTFASRLFISGVDDKNLLRVARKELRGVTLSPRGALSVSHSDDYHGVVFYACGVKLWFFIDKPKAAGKEGIPDFYDLKLPDTVNKSAFSLSEFASMHRSWWTMTGANQLLAIPAHMLHRVITVEPTMGVTLNYESPGSGS